ncbi:hypothetical protein NQ315_007845 [Exocentrus adspersus]|uniref:Uncharacterized protein n=1 Tax=Exocentrus adspersus TaxID=1586481 RepID=A0AAV8W820_9CUCU|nr:hypothetical protein NQ315_007845 [Exocentrus adspersus]
MLFYTKTAVIILKLSWKKLPIIKKVEKLHNHSKHVAKADPWRETGLIKFKLLMVCVTMLSEIECKVKLSVQTVICHNHVIVYVIS